MISKSLSKASMLRWRIPAKTFLIGEYAATVNGAAIILTTTPCFELQVVPVDATENTEAECSELPGQSLHPDSPAGRWAKQYLPAHRVIWRDPYQGIGGLGASSAQFLGAYLASLALAIDNNTACEGFIEEGSITQGVAYSASQPPLLGHDGSTLQLPIFNDSALETLLNAYHRFSWNGEGTKPSGYDLLAQSQFGCVSIHSQKNHLTCYRWPFPDLDFLLIHTGQKYPTHEHLKTISLAPHATNQLSFVAEQAQIAFEQTNSCKLVDAINRYQEQLEALSLTATHTHSLIKHFRTIPAMLAVKGCGALGADVILLLFSKSAVRQIKHQLLSENRRILASSENFYQKNALIKLQSSANLVRFPT